MNDFLLNLFTGKDETKPFFLFPNLSNGIVYATDLHSLISIPENELDLDYGTNEKYPNTQKTIDDFEKNELKSIKVNVFDLAKELTKARIEVDKDSIKCEDCNGEGTVNFKYQDKKGKKHYIGNDCPVCDGEGIVEKESKFARINLFIEDYDKKPYIKINDLNFHPFQLFRLFMVASLKRFDEFEIFYNPNSYGCVMSYFGNIKVMIMLMMRN